ncbi:MAG: WYL domain-containing protein [Bacteroidetes bacterium]|nr:WYL domain-containing protein [Bacteroidota bacterium]
MGWHLIGFCRYRNDYRDFRIDRILAMKVTDETCQTREIKSIKEFFAKMQSSFKLERIVISFPKSTANLIRATRYYYGYISEEEKENTVELNFMVSDTEYFSRWLLMYSDVVEIISPESLREKFLSYITIIKKRFI